MEQGSKSGLMAHPMKGFIRWGRNMEMASLLGPMGQLTLVCLLIIILRERGSTCGPMAGLIKASGKITRWKVKGISTGPMVESIEVLTLMIKKKDLVFLRGLTDVNTKACGKTVNNMEKVPTQPLMASLKKAIGQMERDSIG